MRCGGERVAGKKAVQLFYFADGIVWLDQRFEFHGSEESSATLSPRLSAENRLLNPSVIAG